MDICYPAKLLFGEKVGPSNSPDKPGVRELACLCIASSRSSATGDTGAGRVADMGVLVVYTVSARVCKDNDPKQVMASVRQSSRVEDIRGLSEPCVAMMWMKQAGYKSLYPGYQSGVEIAFLHRDELVSIMQASIAQAALGKNAAEGLAAAPGMKARLESLSSVKSMLDQSRRGGAALEDL